MTFASPSQNAVPSPASLSSSFAIDVSDVAKTYRGKIQALRGISMRVGRGEVFGLLGPNGAGKSTLVKIIMSVIRPTRATGTVLGQAIGKKSTLTRVGYLPEHHRFPKYLTGLQVLDLFGGLGGVDRAIRRKRAPELLDLVGMRDWGDRKIGTYSKGMMQRVGIAQALIGDPDLLLLDEPTDGVDPVGRREIRDIVLQLKSQGKTVFLNSHLLSELELVCDRVAIMVNGTVARQGTLDELALGRGHYEIVTDPSSQQFDMPASLAAMVSRTNSAAGDLIKVATLDVNEVQPVIDLLRKNGMTIRKLNLIRPTLEDMFIEAVREQYGEENGQPGRAVGAKR